LVAKVRFQPKGAPIFAALPEVIKDAGVNEFPGQGPGFLRNQFGPFRIQADVPKGKFATPALVPAPALTPARLDDRKRLLNQLDQVRRALDAVGDLDRSYAQAFALLGSPAVAQAFDLEREATAVRDSYGAHLFGQGCLLARRLLEAGVALVTVYWHYEGPDDSPVWDTHWDNYAHLRNRLMPPADQALAALLNDLAMRGLLDETLIICMGEFGRSPRINAKGGREHWPHVQSVLLAGAGIQGGSVYGASDRIGAYPADCPATPADLIATVLLLLGVPAGLEVIDRLGRPLPACTGSPIWGVLA
jgi:hypothetical protein